MKKSLTRREFLKNTAVLSSATVCASQLAVGGEALRRGKGKRPNIIFLMSDQQQMILRYRANCSWIDSMFGRVMKKLQTKGILDNCLIVYVSDHGEMLGERYYRFNKYCLFESSVRVPMIIAGTAVGQRKRGTLDHRPAELVDVHSTILKVAGIEGDNRKPGRDLLGPVVKTASFCEFHNQPKTSGYMWRKKDCKLILCMDKSGVKDGFERADIVSGELYDLNTDPQEFNNVFDDAKYAAVRQRMSDELIEHLAMYAKPTLPVAG